MGEIANKFAGVRAASCYDEVMAEMSRRHNDVNVLCLPGDLIGNHPVVDLVRVWLPMIDGRPYKTLKRHLASHGLDSCDRLCGITDARETVEHREL